MRNVSTVTFDDLHTLIQDMKELQSNEINLMVKWRTEKERDKLAVEQELASFDLDKFAFIGDIYEVINISDWYPYTLKTKGIYKDGLSFMLTLEERVEGDKGFYNYEVILFDDITALNTTFQQYF